MVLEKMGKWLFTHIRPSIFYLLIAMPALLSLGILVLQHMETDDLEIQFFKTCRKGKEALERKKVKEDFLQRYSHADPYFLGNAIEPILFLKQEQKELQKLFDHPALADKHAIRERLEFLMSDQNRLRFTEEEIRSGTHIKETVEEQRHRVEIDEQDLKQLLSMIEDVPIEGFSVAKNRPQIIVTDLHFERKNSPFYTNVLELEMKLLTREFFK